MSFYHSGLHKVVSEKTPYMVTDPGNGELRRYNVSAHTVRAWRDIVSKWPSIATSDLMDPFEQEVERANDGYSWSGGYMRDGDVLEILLDLAEKKASGKL
jgi:hypothetical protein